MMEYKLHIDGTDLLSELTAAADEGADNLDFEIAFKIGKDKKPVILKKTITGDIETTYLQTF